MACWLGQTWVVATGQGGRANMCEHAGPGRPFLLRDPPATHPYPRARARSRAYTGPTFFTHGSWSCRGTCGCVAPCRQSLSGRCGWSCGASLQPAFLCRRRRGGGGSEKTRHGTAILQW